MTTRRSRGNDALEPERRRRKRGFIWPLVLACILAGTTWTLAQAATLPSPPVDSPLAAEFATNSAQSPIDAAVPTGAAGASPAPAAFGPQLEVVLPPPAPRPATGGKKSVTMGMAFTDFCRGGAQATASPGSVKGLLDAVNTERARIGSPALTWNASLAADAASWSGTMAANQSAHPEYYLTSESGSPLVGSQEWVDAVFHHSGLGAENIDFAYGRGTSPAGAHAAWMKSQGHCENVMNPRYTQFGAGDAWAADSSYFATERFS